MNDTIVYLVDTLDTVTSKADAHQGNDGNNGTRHRQIEYNKKTQSSP